MRPIAIYAKLVLTMIFWGGTFVAARVAVSHATPFFVASCRFGLSTALLFLILAAKSRRAGQAIPIPSGRRQILGLAAIGATGIFFYNFFFLTGLKYTTASNGSLIVALNPVVTALLAALFLRERIGALQTVGFGLSFLGVGTIISHGSWAVISGLSFNHGDLIILGAPLCWAVYTILGKRVMAGLPPLATVAWSTLFGTLFLIPAAAVERLLAARPLDLTGSYWLAILQLALLGTVLGFVWWYQAIDTLGTARSAIFVNLVPLFAILQGAFFLGERLEAAQVFGGLLVLGGILLGQWAATRA